MEPGFLVASPQMRDSNFSRTVVLLVQHSPDGALGLVINRELQHSLTDVVAHLKLGVTPKINRAVLWGGPVERGAGFVVFQGPSTEGWTVPGGIGISSSRERLSALLSSGQDFLLCLGYAGWGPGQLDREFETGSWVYVDPDPALVFGCPTAERYDRALQSLGVTAGNLWMNPVDE